MLPKFAGMPMGLGLGSIYGLHPAIKRYYKDEFNRYTRRASRKLTLEGLDDYLEGGQAIAEWEENEAWWDRWEIEEGDAYAGEICWYKQIQSLSFLGD